MDSLTEKDFGELIETQSESCVSFYMPTHPSLPDARQDPIRFKNLLREAQAALAETRLPANEVSEFLKPARELLDDPVFWRYQADGLAAFLSADQFRKYRLPVSFKELSVVSDRFHIKPLLPLLSSSDRFFVLALSQNKVRLIEGTRHGASEIELEDLPGSLKEIMRDYDFEEQLQFHTRAQPATGGQRAAVYHGQGGGIEDLKPKLIEYFRRIDEGLSAQLKSKKALLVLAGVDSQFPLYREVNTYGNLLDEGIPGNPDALSVEELRRRAWEIVEPLFLKTRHEAADRYQALAGTGRTSNDLAEVVMAAHEGRVEVLFVTLAAQIWGSFDKEQRSVVIHEQAEAGDRDLLDTGAVHTLLNRGLVYAVEREAVPGGAQLAAIFRY